MDGAVSNASTRARAKRTASQRVVRANDIAAGLPRPCGWVDANAVLAPETARGGGSWREAARQPRRRRFSERSPRAARHGARRVRSNLDAAIPRAPRDRAPPAWAHG